MKNQKIVLKKAILQLFMLCGIYAIACTLNQDFAMALFFALWIWSIYYFIRIASIRKSHNVKESNKEVEKFAYGCFSIFIIPIIFLLISWIVSIPFTLAENSRIAEKKERAHNIERKEKETVQKQKQKLEKAESLINDGNRDGMKLLREIIDSNKKNLNVGKANRILGDCFLNGQLVDQDLEKAENYYSNAIKLGDRNSQRGMSTIRNIRRIQKMEHVIK